MIFDGGIPCLGISEIVPAQLVLLAFVECPMALHANITCTNTIVGSIGVRVSSGTITSGTCLQLGDKLFGNFNFGNQPPVIISINPSGPRAVRLRFVLLLPAATTYNFGYQVQFSNSPIITGVTADVGQTVGISSASATLTPPGIGAIDFTATGIPGVGSINSGPDRMRFTPGITDLTVQSSLHIGNDSNASTFSFTMGEGLPVPEPSALEELLLGTGVLGLVGMMRSKLQFGT